MYIYIYISVRRQLAQNTIDACLLFAWQRLVAWTNLSVVLVVEILHFSNLSV